MNTNTQQKIKEILESFKEYFLYAGKSGSSCIPFIKQKHDYDIIIVFPDQESRLKCMNLYGKTFNVKEIIHIYHLDFHFIVPEYDKKHLLENPFYAHTFEERLLTKYDAKNKTIEEVLSDEEKVIKILKEKISSKYSLENRVKYIHKIGYRIYLTLCIYKNKSFDLTEEQIENINILHDRAEKDLAKRIELIDEIIEEIKLWQI